MPHAGDRQARDASSVTLAKHLHPGLLWPCRDPHHLSLPSVRVRLYVLR